MSDGAATCGHCGFPGLSRNVTQMDKKPIVIWPGVQWLILSALAVSSPTWGRQTVDEDGLCSVGPYVMIFRQGSASLDGTNLSVIKAALDNANFCGRQGKVQMTLDGYLGGEGPRLQKARVAILFDYFVDQGLDPESILPRLHGSSQRSSISNGDPQVVIRFEPG